MLPSAHKVATEWWPLRAKCKSGCCPDQTAFSQAASQLELEWSQHKAAAWLWSYFSKTAECNTDTRSWMALWKGQKISAVPVQSWSKRIYRIYLRESFTASTLRRAAARVLSRANTSSDAHGFWVCADKSCAESLVICTRTSITDNPAIYRAVKATILF